MDIDKIVEGACARATLDFWEYLEERSDYWQKEKDYILTNARAEALKETVPILVKNTLKYALADIIENNTLKAKSEDNQSE